MIVTKKEGYMELLQRGKLFGKMNFTLRTLASLYGVSNTKVDLLDGMQLLNFSEWVSLMPQSSVKYMWKKYNKVLDSTPQSTLKCYSLLGCQSRRKLHFKFYP